MNAQRQKLKEKGDLVQQERDNIDIYSEEMDSCLRSSSLLYARLFTSSERIHVADRRSKTRLSKNREIS
jgi:hypothetical protein